MLVAIGMFKGADGIDLLARVIAPHSYSAEFPDRSPADRAHATAQRRRDDPTI